VIDIDLILVDNLGSVGIIFRYIDEENYWILEFNQRKTNIFQYKGTKIRLRTK